MLLRTHIHTHRRVGTFKINIKNKQYRIYKTKRVMGYDHLLLHCSFAKELWDMIFTLFGIQWVMPRRVVEMLACWQGSLGRHQNIVIWKAILHCMMWCVWRERNARTFEGCELLD